MKKKYLIISLLLMLVLSGCGKKEIVAINIEKSVGENSQSINNNILGKTAMIKLGNGLYYDSVTGIVYWWNGNMNCLRSDTTPTPYHSPNGLLYRYIPETNTLEEITHVRHINDCDIEVKCDE